MRAVTLHALTAAVEALDTGAISEILTRGPGLARARIPAGGAGRHEQTLLHRAIPPDGEPLTAAHETVIRTLLDAGAEVDGLGWGANNGVCTPLTMAAWGGHVPLVRLLLSRGAAPNGSPEQAARRHRPVDTAAAHGHAGAVEALIDGGSDFSLSHLLQADMTPRLETLLGENPGAANERLEDGTPPLHLAASTEATRLLLTAGADPSATDPAGRTALHAAIEAGRADVARRLIENGAPADIFAAAGLGDAARVARLLEAEPGSATAAQADGVTPLFYGAFAGDADSCERLLAGGAAVSPHAKRFWACLTPLHLALQRGQRDVLFLLLSHGADPNAFAAEEGRYWPTPLHTAVRWGGVETVSLLLDHGADPNGGDCGDDAAAFGTSGLTWAVYAGNEAVVRVLLERGLDPRHPAHHGALHLAAEHGRAGVARLLLENGADPRARDAQGKTPRDRAVRFGRAGFVALLDSFVA